MCSCKKKCIIDYYQLISPLNELLFGLNLNNICGGGCLKPQFTYSNILTAMMRH